MTKVYLASLSGSLFSGDQRQALDTIGLQKSYASFGVFHAAALSRRLE